MARRNRMMDHEVIVVGGGAAGLGAVRAARWAGADVAMVTDSAPGGDCTFTGCVPSKTLLAAARDGLDFTEAMDRVRTTVAHIAATESIEVLRGEGVTVIEGRARLTTHDTVTVGDSRITAPRIVLATGSRPSLPDHVRGLAESRPLTNETVFNLTEAPESLAIIGGGATGCELAQAFAALGTEVTLFEQGPQLLPSEEPEAAALVRAALQQYGVSVRRLARVERVEPAGSADTAIDGPYRLIWKRAHSAAVTDPVIVERLLVAAGRTPVTEGLGLDEMKIKLSPYGHVLTDDRLSTSIKGVYAAGDVTAWPPPPPVSGRRFDNHLVERGVIDATGRLRVRPDSEPVQTALEELGIRTGTLVAPHIRFGVRGYLADALRRFQQRDRWHFYLASPRHLRQLKRGRQWVGPSTLPPPSPSQGGAAGTSETVPRARTATTCGSPSWWCSRSDRGRPEGDAVARGRRDGALRGGQRSGQGPAGTVPGRDGAQSGVHRPRGGLGGRNPVARAPGKPGGLPAAGRA